MQIIKVKIVLFRSHVHVCFLVNHIMSKCMYVQCNSIATSKVHFLGMLFYLQEYTYYLLQSQLSITISRSGIVQGCPVELVEAGERGSIGDERGHTGIGLWQQRSGGESNHTCHEH